MAADDGTFLKTAPQRVLFIVGAHAALLVMTTVFVGAVALVTLRVGGFDELDPAGTAWRITAVVLVWEVVTDLVWGARHWRGPAGLGTLVRTGRSEKRTRPGRRSRALRWTRDAVALAAIVFVILLIRFPDQPSAPWAAAEVLVVVKGLQLGMFGSTLALEKALNRLRRHVMGAHSPSNPQFVPVEDILGRPDIARLHPYQSRHARD